MYKPSHIPTDDDILTMAYLNRYHDLVPHLADNWEYIASYFLKADDLDLIKKHIGKENMREYARRLLEEWLSRTNENTPWNKLITDLENLLKLRHPYLAKKIKTRSLPLPAAGTYVASY